MRWGKMRKLTRRWFGMMKALNDLCIKISLCNRMSLVSMLNHKDRSVPSSCRMPNHLLCKFFPYFSFLFFLAYFFLLSSIVMKFVCSKYSVCAKIKNPFKISKGKFWYFWRDFWKNNKKAEFWLFDPSLQLLRFQCAL